MIRYIAERLIMMIFLLLGISLISFLMMQLAPGNYLDTLAMNPQISPVYIAHMKEKFGLDLPWYIQYFRWMKGILPHPAGGDWRHWSAFDFGISFAQQVPVFTLLKPAMFNTFILAVSSVVVSWAIAVPLGVYGAVKQNGPLDQASVFFAYVGFAVPDFFLALILLFLAARVRLIPFGSMLPAISICAVLLAILGGFFSLSKQSRRDNAIHFLKGAIVSGILSWVVLFGLFYLFQKADFPIGGMEAADFDFLSPWRKFLDLMHHLALPTAVLAVGNVAYLMRQMRASMLDVFRADYMTTARAKGLPERQVIFKHAFRNALNPMITLFGFELGFLLSGALAVEIVMSWPGLGRLIYEAIIQKDLYVVMGDLMLSSFLLIVGNLIADVLLAWADPRIKVSS